MAVTNVFVSHSHRDEAFTHRLVADLKQAGATVWVDVAGVGAGDFQKRINDALLACEWVVIVMTQNALTSPWVEQEVNAAIRLKHQGRIRDIIPLQAGPVDLRTLPPLWGVFNVFDATGLADRFEIQLSYAIGVARPLSIFVETFGTAKVSDEELIALIREHFDLRPAGIIQTLDLRRPIYQPTAAFGHFGRTDIDAPWERLDKVEELR
jgi:hypothetical protein